MKMSLNKRGLDPDLAPEYNSIEHIEELDHMWMGGGIGSEGFGLVNIHDITVPDNAKMGESKDFSMKFEIVDEPQIFTIPNDGWNPKLEDLVYYTVLIVDGKVCDVSPNTPSGRAEPGGLDTNTIEEVNFTTTLRQEGTFEVEFGVYIISEIDSIEWIHESGSPFEITVYGP